MLEQVVDGPLSQSIQGQSGWALSNLVYWKVSASGRGEFELDDF